MVLICGIDESGRGPVIGSLVIVGVLIEEKDVSKLEKIGVKDSKLLTHKKRMFLAEKIKKIVKKYKIIEIEPKEIDEAIDGNQSLNLNWLEAHKTVEIINELKPDKAIIDCPSPNIKKYKDYLIKLLNNKDIELVIEHHAEKHFPVGAASIIAKCIREEEVEKIKKKYNIEFGSGYPSDSNTKKFLEENFNNPELQEIFRKSWIPFKNHMNKQKSLSDFQE
ncbi:MAG: ribonuclease HII [Nanoarchaeota archaeon]|nr:ribonuclease HII [Nanoarchaeota archaeon]MBU0963006.1 ribonuclease HII [Nanoarchaeota archaeon]